MEPIDTYQKFLVVQTASIGDVILATSVLETLHLNFPGAFIGMVVKKGCDELFSGHPYLNKLYTWDKSKNKTKNLRHIISEIRSEKFDVVINLHRFASSGWLTLRSKGRIKAGFDKNPFSVFFDIVVKHQIGMELPKHETVRNHELLSSFTGGDAAKMKLYPRDEDYSSVLKFKNKPYITVAPLSLWYTKQYPEERWMEMIKNISGNFNIYLLGSQKDRAQIETMTGAYNNNVFNLAGELSLLQTAALMKSACMNFTNDSAPMHLASAMNAPITAVFCSTVPEFGFGPVSDDSAIIQTEENLKCRPCGLHGFKKCPENTMACAYGIPVAKLTERIKPCQ